MTRKHFLSFLFTTGASIYTLKGEGTTSYNLHMGIGKLPPYLKQGDIIGITSPASYISLAQIQPAIQLMESWGYTIQTGESIGKKDYTLGGTDSDRLADFQRMLDDPNINAIMCARGGYGAIRILDQLDFTRFRSNPKWIIGFSDITVFHAHINTNYGIATIHSKMCNSFPDVWLQANPIQMETILSIKHVLSGDAVKYSAPPSHFNRFGRAEGLLVGGNLSILETLAGTKSDLKTKGKILFLEDTQEQLYSIDRMLWNLKRSGKLKRLKGLIIGGFKLKVESSGDEFGKTLYELVSEKIKEYDYPVCFDFPVGHQINNFALKCGAMHVLNVNKHGSSLVSI